MVPFIERAAIVSDARFLIRKDGGMRAYLQSEWRLQERGANDQRVASIVLLRGQKFLFGHRYLSIDATPS